MNPLEQIIVLTLTAGEVNQLLYSLGQRPFVEVAALIPKVKQQGDEQFVVPAPEDAALAETAN